MSTKDSRFKTKAVQFQEAVENYANKITKFDDQSFDLFKSLNRNVLKNGETRKGNFAQNTFEDKDNNFGQRKELFDKVKKLQETSAAKFEEIQQTIESRINEKKQENELNQKKFAEIRKKFDGLHERSMELSTNADPNRWRRVQKF